jgi:hypothetical protein
MDTDVQILRFPDPCHDDIFRRACEPITGVKILLPGTEVQNLPVVSHDISEAL